MIKDAEILLLCLSVPKDVWENVCRALFTVWHKAEMKYYTAVKTDKLHLCAST